jgi:putative nucleotidyltransferase with HDIG domain
MPTALAPSRTATTPIQPGPRSEALGDEIRALLDGRRARPVPCDADLLGGLLNAMLRTLSLRDSVTARHSVAVAAHARELAAADGASPADQDLVHTAGILHDVGKFILPDSILRARGSLSAADWQLVKRHPAAGAEIVAAVPGLETVARAIRHHHERIDGAGYPDGLSGDEIPWMSRVLSVVDAYDAMTQRGSYSRTRSPVEAVVELRRVAGTQLDAGLVERFVALLGGVASPRLRSVA